ncbi:antibiotic biosynthesis monooxygenase family protein [Halomonas sp. PR-M31]|uniref:antibiotic biosynthesis monooxygenase family protein n=1 Tax=Halomonas sp. PR-M31 TaxID=1471202 RepID=UPI00069DE875|nr:antibiotic biosynthesis monooxygenase family protein [Halomonas sp. PR-M31]
MPMSALLRPTMLAGLVTVLIATSTLAPAVSRAPNDDAKAPVLQTQPDHLTMINVFTPTSGTQDEVAAAIQEGLDESVSRLPGFINATVHKSRDNDYVVVYAQWEDQAAVDAAVETIQGGGAPAMMRAFTIATPDFHPYDVLSVHLAK